MQKKDFQNWSREKLLHEYKELLKRKKFGIVWEDKPEDVAEQCKTSLPVLKEEKKKDLSADNNDVTHIIIEGDNYHALSVLNYTHKRKIDVIYIDPPYNTGSKSWRYNNDFVDKEDRFRHSKWLSFMSKRLRLAKNLLKEDGALICAVDHNEQEGLGLLLKEIFPGKEITCITVIHNPRGIQGDNFAYTHEFAYFVYPSGKYINRKQRAEEDEEWSNLRNWGGESTREHGKSLFYPIYFKNGKVSKIGETPTHNFHPTKAFRQLKNGELEIWPIDNNGIERKWRYSRETLSEILDCVRVFEVRKIPQVQLLKSEDRYKTVWIDSKYDANIYGTQLVKEIIGKDFPYPKSLYTVRDCIEAVAAQKESAVILDFFAGSGTTGHAVLEMNKRKGNRQFILCTNNEDNNGSGTKIASDICYPRIKNVMRGYIVKGEKVKGLGGNLKYFSTAFVDNVKTDNDKRVFTSRCAEMLCLTEGTFNEVLSKKGAFAIYENQEQMTGIIYDEDAIADFKMEAEKYKKPFVVYVFSYDHTYNEEDFEDLENLRTVKPIPEVILNVYRKIYKELYKPRHL